jgi:hypothetical protein
MDASVRTYGDIHWPAGAPKPAKARAAPEGPRVPCWLCGRPIAIRVTQAGRPFLVCMDCGLQMFVRSSAGEERLKERCSRTATAPVAKAGEPS